VTIPAYSTLVRSGFKHYYTTLEGRLAHFSH
jgi:hypothetical protein